MATNWKGARLHFIGIGGCGMSALALVFHELGATVSGSDQKDSMFTASVRNAGILVTIGHAAEAVPSEGVVVYSSAVPALNPELVEAKRAGREILHRSELMARLTAERRTIAVSGAHGKTTTSTLLAHVLTVCGLDPSYIVGGLPKPPMAHGHAGASDILVIEADESDRSLVRYAVDTLIVTNIDLDHVKDGGYQTKADVAEVINTLARTCKAVITPSHTKEYLEASNVRFVDAVPLEDSRSFTLDGETYRSPFPGAHQIENSGLVVAVAKLFGGRDEDIRRGLETFSGIARRFDRIGTLPSGTPVIDDYAHHPAEVEAVIKAARSMVTGRVVAVFQPHLFSRTKQFAEAFAQALMLADEAYVEAVYPAREAQADWPDVTSALIVDAGGGRVKLAPDRAELTEALASSLGPEDLVLIVGAGDIGRFAQELVTA